ncbi:MAG TPA: hypothetical protein VF736_23195 [Pyrinomonadaceae bacterium]|jgi:hypothetical protein
MRREDLERYLERGDSLGFQKETGDADYLGWILLNKRRYDERLLSLFPERPDFKAEQEYARVCPYQVWVAEFRRDVYEGGECESADDYRLSKNFYFPTLDHVEDFVRAFGHALEEIKWAREIESN